MLWNSTKIHGYAIEASDGPLGSIADFLFDDSDWSIRWLVVDTSHWLPNRKVLLPTVALGQLDSERQQFSVRLSKKQVGDSPNINTDRPVSRQMETDIFENYSWVPYWSVDYLTSGFGPLQERPMGPPDPEARRFRDTENRDGDPHLRSIGEITNYGIQALDGEIGHVCDFLISDTDWSIRYLVVETGPWWSGKRVLISPRWADRVDWIATTISLDVDRETIKDRPDYTEETVVDADYEQRIHQLQAAISPPP